MAEFDPVASWCRSEGLPEPVREYRFHPVRLWRADYCWVAQKVILEVEGGVWTRGRHNRGSGFVKDISKYNEAAALGYRLLRCTPQQIESGAVFDLLERVLREGAA